MKINRVVEYSFFFLLLGISGYMVWLITSPFISAIALSAIIATICYPIYKRILKITPRKNKSIAALVTTLLALVLVILPVIFVSSLVVGEVLSAYQTLTEDSELTIEGTVNQVEDAIKTYIPDFELNLTDQVRQIAEWFTGNITQIFAGTLSTLFIFTISLIGSFYFFRDGKEFLQLLIRISPLPDKEDHIIFKRMAQAVRSVATGTLLVAMIQGVLVAIGFSFVGFDRVILWGSIAAVFAVIPGIGTSLIMFPAIFWLLYDGQLMSAIILAAWHLLVVGMADNVIGPYLMSRGNNLHPFIILIAVLGGISLFGPIGFIVGPVIVTLFIVLLEIYSQYIVQEQLPSQTHTDAEINEMYDKA
jgi:predicted PurR-regulated permease PerM